KHKRSAILNIIQCKQTKPNHPQITVYTSKRRQAGRVNINWAGTYRGSKQRMGRGHRPGSAGSKQRSTEGQAEGWSGSQARDQNRVRQRDRNRMQDRYRAQDKHNTKAESVGLA
ncbi:unnamed protein product, partial [Staurois parvus]